ncbi:hypothetical protein [Opitutus terrae]|uniref:Uncharacterized protein n=1 Tax=Opitutus terrae (strain DSM 11246 / JCM 15787 / PB90-1) TaxID=452637 RepID=B1ZX02_OPITP|nr:hypothetical protein [Opitutus terrae]ACB75113.1 hypothetical protein Oter_1830 [Opitutus terrae PB90-1]
MNESIHMLETSVRLRRSDLVAASPDKVDPAGGYFTNLVKYPG